MKIVLFILPILAFLVSILSLWISTRNLGQQKRVSKITNNYNLLFQTTKLLDENPELFELHNINLEELKAVGLTTKELVYILQSIISAETYYEIENPKSVDFRDFSDYRTNFLDSEKVKLAWTKFIRIKLVFVSPFILAIDDYYKNKEN